MSKEHSDLHHPPVCNIIHLQLPIEYGDLKDSHPGEEADLEEEQREKVCFCGAVECLGPIFTCHGRNGEVLEDKAKGNRKGEV